MKKENKTWDEAMRSLLGKCNFDDAGKERIRKAIEEAKNCKETLRGLPAGEDGEDMSEDVAEIISSLDDVIADIALFAVRDRIRQINDAVDVVERNLGKEKVKLNLDKKTGGFTYVFAASPITEELKALTDVGLSK